MESIRNVLLILLLAISFQSYAENIEPFGALTWNDGLDTTAQKLIKMSDKTIIELRGKKNMITNTGVQPLLQQHHSKFENHLDMLPEYIDQSGNKQKYYSESITIKSEGIIIKGVPFTLKATLTPFKGFAVSDPDSVLYLNSRNISYPHKLTRVVLKSKSPLVTEKYLEIFGLLKEKYPSGKPWVRGNKEDGRFDYDTGETGLSSTFNVDWDVHFEIRYMHRADAPMKKLYQSHAVSIAKKSNSKPDQSGGL